MQNLFIGNARIFEVPIDVVTPALVKPWWTASKKENKNDQLENFRMRIELGTCPLKEKCSYLGITTPCDGQ